MSVAGVDGSQQTGSRWVPQSVDTVQVDDIGERVEVKTEGWGTSNVGKASYR
jgi:hypothetical protein